ncbi:MAG TPA: outer membrane protein transport protein [Planctomycetaceae bacterium]|nr:outer membrane protein transport protein [Planctomycetaceae bacterium]
MRFHRIVVLVAGLLLSASSGSVVLAQYGPFLSGVGPINRSMGGASTAAPLSANGAMYWNPASLAGLQGSQLDVGAELLVPQTQLSSTYAPGTFGPGVPPVPLSGTSTNSEDVFALPSISLSFRPEESNFTYGLGIFASAGFGTNYAASSLAGNPVLSPQPTGFGSIYSQYQVLQIVPAAVWHVDDCWSVSIGPTIDIGRLQIDPGVMLSSNVTGYPSATHTTAAWGVGFQAGVFYQETDWNFGASYKSPQWFQPYQIDSTDATGGPRSATFNLDLPSITSVGAAYKGVDRWLFATDVRYFDFQNTDGYGTSGYSSTGALNGLGYQGIFAVAAGTQYQATEALALRMGYSWNENPVPNSQTGPNVASPLIIQHQLSAGASYQLTKSLVLSAAWTHGFKNSISGPVVLPTGPLAGTSLTSSAYVDSFVFGATVLF